MWATLAIIVITIVFYTLDRFPLELISGGAIVALLVLFLIAPFEGWFPPIRLHVRHLAAGQ